MELAELFAQVVDKLQGWLATAVKMLPNAAVAIAVVLVFGLLSRWLSKLADRGLSRVVKQPQIVSLLTSIVRIAILAGGVFTALSVLNLDKAVTSLLAGVGIVGLALGFAFQDIAANFVSGLLMAVRQPFALGDLVEVGGSFGKVESIDLRATRLTLLSGESVIIPNKDVYQSAIVNYTDTQKRRVEVEVGVSYGDDLVKAKNVALEAVRALEVCDPETAADLVYTGFGGSSIDFTLRFWIRDASQKAFLHARSEAIMAIKEAFDANDVSIPFPIRTLDFGVSGGESLEAHIGERLGTK
ncbi:MAG: mechanosensitive ion channel family protein [Nannocystaceae bacterium]|nr:mechanosensitive ion channel family protein [bacterium]